MGNLNIKRAFVISAGFLIIVSSHEVFVDEVVEMPEELQFDHDMTIPKDIRVPRKEVDPEMLKNLD